MQAVLADLSLPLADIKAIMARTVASKELRVSQLVDELGDFHGKMLRPSLVLLVAGTLGDITDQHLQLGAALELIHTATLIHDDLIDDATIRRGIPTAHLRFGNTTSVLLGDYLYTLAFDLVATLEKPALMRQLTRTTNLICAGELHQQMAARDATITEDEYNRIIHAKTAALCEMAGACGAINGTESQRTAALAYGRLCGMAFQIIDDCFDVSGDPEKIGKTLTTDVERGRMTLPIIRALAEGSATQRAELTKRIATAHCNDDVVAIRQLVIEAGGLSSALSTARRYVADAQAELRHLPAGDGQKKLRELAEFIVARDF